MMRVHCVNDELAPDLTLEHCCFTRKIDADIKHASVTT
jgi:hypothetical protein